MPSQKPLIEIIHQSPTRKIMSHPTITQNGAVLHAQRAGKSKEMLALPSFILPMRKSRRSKPNLLRN